MACLVSREPIKFFLSKREAAASIGLSAQSLMRLVREGKFPQPVRVTDRRPGFDIEEVRAWAEGRKRSARGACDDPFAGVR